MPAHRPRYRWVIGVLTYRDYDLLLACLKSIRANTPRARADNEEPFLNVDLGTGPLLVIANNSQSQRYIETVEATARTFDACCISFRKNRGTSAAWNAMARLYDCERFVILNDDMRVFPGWLRALDEALDDPRMGMASLSHYIGDRDWQTRTTGGDADPMTVPLQRHWAAYPLGSLLAIRCEVFDRVGGFDENFWIGCEEVDMGVRVWQAGYRCANITADKYLFAAHKGGGTGYASATPDASVPPELREVMASQGDYFRRKHGVRSKNYSRYR